MNISWRERLAQNPDLADLGSWPSIDIRVLPKARRKTFYRRMEIVKRVLNGEKFEDIKRATGISNGAITQLMNKALGGDDCQPPALSRAFIPYHSSISRQRKQALPTIISEVKCSPCCFKALLNDVKGLKSGLDAMIQAKVDDKDHAQLLTPKTFHDRFLSLLEAAHWPQDTYPYNTDGTGYDAARAYLYAEMAARDMAKSSSTHGHSTHRPVELARRALRAVQIDAHKLDVKQTLYLHLNDELIPLRITRLWVLVMIDVDTRCILGYHLSYSEEVNQQDVLALFEAVFTPWKPLELMTPYLAYTPGSGFPSGIIDDMPITITLLQLDNAMTHRAYSIKHLACHVLGATLSYGHPRCPTIRYLVESIFHYINRENSHHYASTTGSNVLDPKKESRKNSKRPPVVTVQIFLEALSVILSDYNTLPQASLGNACPLDLFKHHVTHQFMGYVPAPIRQQWQPFLTQQDVVVHHPKDNGRPYVHFGGVKNKGPCLANIRSGTHINVIFNRKDVRTIQAYTKHGTPLGALHAPITWQRFPHSLHTRQLINKLNRKARFKRMNPLTDFFRYLLESKGKEKMATRILNVYTEYTQNDDDLRLSSITTEVELASRKRKRKPHAFHDISKTSNQYTKPYTWRANTKPSGKPS